MEKAVLAAVLTAFIAGFSWGESHADEATAGVRYHFYKPNVQRQLSPGVRRSLSRPSVSGSRRLLREPRAQVDKVERGQARSYKRELGQSIRRLQSQPGASDARTERRLRVLRGEKRRISRGLNRAR